MSLSESEIQNLLKLIQRTELREINCDQCLALVAEFAETQLAGKSLPDGLNVVQQHLAICAECREEYLALEAALKQIEE